MKHHQALKIFLSVTDIILNNSMIIYFTSPLPITCILLIAVRSTKGSSNSFENVRHGIDHRHVRPSLNRHDHPTYHK